MQILVSEVSLFFVEDPRALIPEGEWMDPFARGTGPRRLRAKEASPTERTGLRRLRGKRMHETPPP